MTEVIGNSLNEPTTTLAAALTSGATTLTVVSASSLPGSGTFRIRIDDELITVGSISGTTLSTLGRGAESTTATSHSSGADVNLILTAEGLATFVIENGGTPAPYTSQFRVRIDLPQNLAVASLLSRGAFVTLDMDGDRTGGFDVVLTSTIFPVPTGADGVFSSPGVEVSLLPEAQSNFYDLSGLIVVSDPTWTNVIRVAASGETVEGESSGSIDWTTASATVIAGTDLSWDGPNTTVLSNQNGELYSVLFSAQGGWD